MPTQGKGLRTLILTSGTSISSATDMCKRSAFICAMSSTDAALTSNSEMPISSGIWRRDMPLRSSYPKALVYLHQIGGAAWPYTRYNHDELSTQYCPAIQQGKMYHDIHCTSHLHTFTHTLPSIRVAHTQAASRRSAFLRPRSHIHSRDIQDTHLDAACESAALTYPLRT